MPPDLRESITAASLREDVLVEPVDALVQKSVVLWRKASDIDEDGNDWERLVTLEKEARVHKGVHVVPVRVSKWKVRDNSVVAHLKRLFRSRNEYDPTVLYRPDGTQMEEGLVKRRRALMVWAKDAGVPLDEKAMMELVPPPREQPSTAAGRGGIESIESLGANVRLMNMKPEVMDKLQKNALNTHSKELTSISMLVPSLERKIENKFLHFRKTTESMNPNIALSNSSLNSSNFQNIIDTIQKFGSISSDINPLSSERFCVCIKHFHGNDSTTKMLSSNEEAAQLFLMHNDNIVFFTEMLAALVRKQNICYFLEGYPIDPVRMQRQYQLATELAENPPISDYENIDLSDASKAKELFAKIAQFDKSDPDSAEIMRALISSNLRIVRNFLSQGMKGQCYGLENNQPSVIDKSQEDLRRIAKEKKLNYDQIMQLAKELGNQLIAERMKTSNAYLSTCINEKITKGEVGVVVLGGAHFKHQVPQKEDAWLYPNTKAEDFFLKNADLKNMRIITIHLSCFAKLASITDAQWSKKYGKYP